MTFAGWIVTMLALMALLVMGWWIGRVPMSDLVQPSDGETGPEKDE